MFGLARLFGATPTKNELAKKVLVALRAAHPGDNFAYDESQYQIRGKGSLVMNLDNLYLDYCRSTRNERQTQIERFIAGMTAEDIPDSFLDAQPNLLPVLRHLAGLELSLLSMDEERQKGDFFTQFAMQPFSEELAIGIAFDSEVSIQQVGNKTLETWGKTLDEVLAVALDNLRHKAAPKFEEISPGFFVSQFDDYYDASRLLLPELAWQLPLNGNPVAMVPNRICLLITGDRDEAGLEAMLATAEGLLRDQSRPLGTEMFRLDGTAWTPWKPSGAVEIRLHDLRIQMRAGDYKAQQEVLSATAERRGEDVFVATFGLTKQPNDDRIFSYSVLTKSVHTWLPKTDRVCANDLDTKEQLMVPWSVFESAAGDILEPMSYVLPRYRVAKDLGQQQLEILRTWLKDSESS